MDLAYMELVVFQYMLIVFAQLLTVESRIVCRQTKNTKVTKDVETIVNNVDERAARTASPLLTKNTTINKQPRQKQE